MVELRFDKTLYEGTAVDASVKVYEKYGEFELTEADDAWIVKVSGDDQARAHRVAGELANYALGLTARARSGS